VDCFQILQLPRAPWLDEDAARDQFQRLAATVHPDAAQGNSSAFVALNHAWQVLKAPTSRLRHYLELEYPETLAAAAPNPAISGDLFMDVAGIQQEAASLASKLAAAQSPLARAVLEGARVKTRAKLDSVSERVGNEIAAIHERIQTPNAAPAALAACLGELVFLEKWAAQLRERAVALS
jgi:curved DNA-binding protein CbpA